MSAATEMEVLERLLGRECLDDLERPVVWACWDTGGDTVRCVDCWIAARAAQEYGVSDLLVLTDIRRACRTCGRLVDAATEGLRKVDMHGRLRVDGDRPRGRRVGRVGPRA